MDQLFPVMLFAVSASVTPGPNNIMVMTSGVNFGVRKSLPLITGICVGFALMLLVIGFGFAQLFTLFPHLHLVIKITGVVYLLYLAYLIARSANNVNTQSQSTPLGFMKGALFQWVNGKAWVVATGAIAAFTSIGENQVSQQLVIAGTFLVVSFPCVGVWLAFGSLLKNYLNSPRSRALFNWLMAGLLVISVMPVVTEIAATLAAKF